MTRRIFAIALFVALFAAIQAPAAWATNAGPPVLVTVKNGPVEIPGRVLSPGKYEFTFVDPYHQVVDVQTADGAEIGYFLVMPAERTHHIGRARVDLSPVPGSPERIKDFFFGGETVGFAFIYPHASTSAKATSGTRP